MYERMGEGFIGSPNLLTSTANMEVVPAKPSGWTLGYTFYKFSFNNLEACHVTVNQKNTIYLLANQGFNTDSVDVPITSFVIQENGIQFNWLGAF